MKPKASSLPVTTESIANIALRTLAENGFQARPLIGEQHNPSDAEARLKIKGEQTIRTADELHKSLTEYLDRGLAVILDLSEVHVCDIAALQLMYSVRQSAVQRKQLFHITAVSPAIIETAAALGLCIEAMTACGPTVADGDGELPGKDNGI